MPRGRIPVKNIPGSAPSRGQLLARGLGAVDLHFHGAFGIDLMTARIEELDQLSARLYREGVSGFCPTTLSSSPEELEETCARLGHWIRSESAPGALPLGIHLEGPFISPQAAGAHPESALRMLTPAEVERLWKLSKRTLKILTLAPDAMPADALKWICRFSKKNRIRLSLGHSRCTEAVAKKAFDQGFTGVTHAWNALAYHHRDAGALGAAFGRRDVFTELILDRIHVSETFIDWTLRLHPHAVVFVSDAAPAAGTDGQTFHAFGALKCRFENGASRLPDGSLAGGGVLLPAAFFAWLKVQARRENVSLVTLFKRHLASATQYPLQSIFLKSSALRSRPVEWRLNRELQATPAKGLSKRP